MTDPYVRISEPAPTIVEPARSIVEIVTEGQQVVSILEPTPTAPSDLGNYATIAALDAAIATVDSQITGLDATVADIETRLGTGFRFDQPVGSAIWRIEHHLDYYPGGVTVVDSTGAVTEPDVQYLDINTVQLTFSRAISGTAYLS